MLCTFVPRHSVELQGWELSPVLGWEAYGVLNATFFPPDLLCGHSTGHSLRVRFQIGSSASIRSILQYVQGNLQRSCLKIHCLKHSSSSSLCKERKTSVSRTKPPKNVFLSTHVTTSISTISPFPPSPNCGSFHFGISQRPLLHTGRHHPLQ